MAPAEIAKAVTSCTNAKREMMVQAGLKRVQSFDIDKMVKSYLRVYMKICIQDR